MKILLVTNMFPTKEIPFFGIFVKEQMKAVEELYPGVIYDVYFIEGGSLLGGGFLKSVKNYIKSIIVINKKINEGDYDLTHIHFGLAGLFMLMPFRKRIPTILTLHGGDILVEQNGSWEVKITKQIIKRCVYTISLNDRMLEIVKRYTPNTSIIPCAVDTQLFVPPKKIQNNKKPLIVFPSAKTRTVKNYPLFINVLEIIRKEYGINCDFCEIDQMGREEVCLLFQRADLLLMTSISEGSPQVVKEAMSCNLPVVSTPVGDVRLLLEGVKNSAVAQTHNADELAKLCVDSLKKRIDGIDGREKIIQLGIDRNTIANKIYKLYNRFCYGE